MHEKAINPPFHQASYLTQVRRLRDLATQALRRFPVRVKYLTFITHGENTTFQVQTEDKHKYLLRIHRHDYHKKEAIEEELAWLKDLAKTDLRVPHPVRSKAGRYVETVSTKPVAYARHVDLLEWVNGHFVFKSVAHKHLHYVGGLIADLQINGTRFKPKHRRYWTAEGMLGNKPKMGPIHDINGVTHNEQRLIDDTRRVVLAELRDFERKFPERHGLIHADLHFGNLVMQKNHWGAIDFDDCGWGFHAYDLVIPFLSVQGMLDSRRQKQLLSYKDALLQGYTQKRSWDQHDERIFWYLVCARKLLMMGWLQARSDNPRIKKLMQKRVDKTIEYLKKEFKAL